MARFNGAVTLSLQKLKTDCRHVWVSVGFNGAVTLSLQKFVIYYLIKFPFQRFNGAVTLSLQKSGLPYKRSNQAGKGLQWSCNFIVTEIV